MFEECWLQNAVKMLKNKLFLMQNVFFLEISDFKARNLKLIGNTTFFEEFWSQSAHKILKNGLFGVPNVRNLLKNNIQEDSWAPGWPPVVPQCHLEGSPGVPRGALWLIFGAFWHQHGAPKLIINGKKHKRKSARFLDVFLECF